MMKIMPKEIIVVLDSNELIFGLIGKEQYPKILIGNLNKLKLNCSFRINRQIVKEVLDNIPNYHHGKFFRLIDYGIIKYDSKIIDKNLLNKYSNLKLKKGDNVIAAYAESVKAKTLISENRHFLKELKTRKFKIVNAEQFLKDILK